MPNTSKSAQEGRLTHSTDFFTVQPGTALVAARALSGRRKTTSGRWVGWLVVLLALPAFATTRFVATTGSDSGDCSSQASPCKTIGFAITQSSSGDTINVAAGSYAEHVIINKNLTIQGGLSGTTTVDGSAGTGITVNSGVTATLSDLTITKSTNSGIVNNGTLTVTNSTVSGNSSVEVGPFDGGGIFNFHVLTVTNSTISGNSANREGGGIYSVLLLTVTNSTISGNTGLLDGGGISFQGSLTVTNSTISGNSTDRSGGGIVNNGSFTSLTNTILSSNSGGNCQGTAVTSKGHNLSDDATCSFGGTGDMNSTDPKLGPLQNNGGPTQTMALLEGSLAIDAGDDTAAGSLATDQRGSGFPRKSGAHVDIGAFEFQFAPGTRYVATTGFDTNNDCSQSATPCLTIQHAVNEAFSGDTIKVAAGTYGENVIVGKNVTIQGSLSGTTTVDGSGGIFTAITVNLGVTATLSNLMLTKSSNSGIVNHGTLTVTNSTISGNFAAGSDGGGIENFGTLTVTNSTISGNSTSIGAGGGIENDGTLTVTNSTISGNVSGFGGGGIFNDAGTLRMTNTTISGNTASGGANGGGIFNLAGSTLTVTNSTISGNTATGGGGIFTGGTISLTNTILSNTNGGNCFDNIPSGGHNLSSDATCGFGAPGDMNNTDPQLGPLANNGGPTLTMALLPGSPAIDAGDDAVLGPPLSLATDQRGPGFPRLCGQHVDIGAFESGDPDCTATMLVVDVNPAIAGQTVTFTATVTKLVNTVASTPTGTVTFKDGLTTLGTGTLDSNGIASFSTSSLSVGGHSITATYGGDSVFKGSVSAVVNEVVNQASSATALSPSANPSLFGAIVTFTATVTDASAGSSGTPTGMVTFKEGVTTLGTSTLDSGGIASFSTASLSVGGHSITATYGGDSAFKGSASAALNEVVNPASSATALGSSANPSPFGTSVTFTATVSDASAGSSGTPTGTVTFKDGGSTLGAGTLDGGGTATFSTSSLAVGPHSITAVYGGDSNFAGSSSAALNETVNPSNITITASPSSISLVSGTSGTVTLTITGNGPFPLLVHCIGNMVSCSVTTPVAGQNSSTATLTIDSSGKLARSSPNGPWVGRSAAIFLGMMTPLAVLMMKRERKGNRRKQRKALSAVMLGLLLVATALSSCGGGPPPVGGVARGTYFVNVVATSAGVTGTTAVTITVR